MAQSFRDLEVWQAAMDLTLQIYQLTSTFPNQELYGLTSQMRRASVSIASNIAEGAGRETRRDFRQFVTIARGSNCELHTQLLIAARLGYCPNHQFEQTEHLVTQVGRMLNGLARYLKLESRKPPLHTRP